MQNSSPTTSQEDTTDGCSCLDCRLIWDEMAEREHMAEPEPPDEADQVFYGPCY